MDKNSVFCTLYIYMFYAYTCTYALDNRNIILDEGLFKQNARLI